MLSCITTMVQALKQSPGREDLEKVYGEDYFWGRTSGYSQEGYGRCHPDWKPWITFVQQLKPVGIWLDVGCAYGFLPLEAQKAGFTSLGVDISRYALVQSEEPGRHLLQSRAETLPLSDDSVDIVSVFDVLEHLANPQLCLKECMRILKGDGLLIGSTPDPLFFDREELTHISEYPPSYWIATLRELGAKTTFRFSNTAYNFQFLATPLGSPLNKKFKLFQHDYFSEEEDFLEISGEAFGVLRTGWCGLKNRARAISDGQASIYLLNPSDEPVRLTISMRVQTSPAFSTLRVRLGSTILTELYLNSEKLVHEVELPPIAISRGGHHLFIDLFPGGPRVYFSHLEISGRQVEREAATQPLPFDLYQRYKLTAQILEIMRPQTVLDVGGVLGERDGHLAVSSDFFAWGEGTEVWSTDLRPMDHPYHRVAHATSQPFSDHSFDAVVSLDVLEHIPPQTRQTFFEELDRVSSKWILLGGPMQSAEVSAVEESLRDAIGTAHLFLNQHLEFGLPERKDLLEYFEQKQGYQVLDFPSGYLPRWLTMQTLTRIFHESRQHQALRLFNAFYNRNCFPADQREPAYRHIFLICKEPSAVAVREKLDQLKSKPEADCRRGEGLVSLIPLVQRRRQQEEEALSQAQFIANARQDYIDAIEAAAKKRELSTALKRFLTRWLGSEK